MKTKSTRIKAFGSIDHDLLIIFFFIWIVHWERKYYKSNIRQKDKRINVGVL